MHVTDIAKLVGLLAKTRHQMIDLLMLITLDEVNLIIEPDLQYDREFMGKLEMMRGKNDKLKELIAGYKKQIEEAKKGPIDVTPLPEFRAQPLSIGDRN